MKKESPIPPTESEFDTPAFDEAVSRFRRFIESNAGSSQLFWVFREEVTVGATTCVRVPVPEENCELAAEYYEFGRNQGLGVTLAAHCLVGSRSACYVWVPKDGAEAA